ncbi:hypothetical protein D3C78_1131440 [compost metagenome]
MLLVLFIDKNHPAANLHLVRCARLGNDLGALYAGSEVAQVALCVGPALLVGVFALGLQVAVQGVQLN